MPREAAVHLDLAKRPARPPEHRFRDVRREVRTFQSAASGKCSRRSIATLWPPARSRPPRSRSGASRSRPLREEIGDQPQAQLLEGIEVPEEGGLAVQHRLDDPAVQQAVSGSVCRPSRRPFTDPNPSSCASAKSRASIRCSCRARGPSPCGSEGDAAGRHRSMPGPATPGPVGRTGLMGQATVARRRPETTRLAISAAISRSGSTRSARPAFTTAPGIPTRRSMPRPARRRSRPGPGCARRRGGRPGPFR